MQRDLVESLVDDLDDKLVDFLVDSYTAGFYSLTITLVIPRNRATDSYVTPYGALAQSRLGQGVKLWMTMSWKNQYRV